MMHRKNRIEYRGSIWLLVDSLVEALIVGVSVEEGEANASALTTFYFFLGQLFSRFIFLFNSARDIFK